MLDETVPAVPNMFTDLAESEGLTMRLHTNRIERGDLYAAAAAAGVRIIETIGGRSQTHRAAWDVKLTGASPRLTNPGAGHSDRSDLDNAATWDQWGAFLSHLYAIDPTMRAGGSRREPIYADADDFRTITCDRYRDGLPADHHVNGHRWAFDGDGLACTGCTARLEHRTATSARRVAVMA